MHVTAFSVLLNFLFVSSLIKMHQTNISGVTFSLQFRKMSQLLP